MVCENCTREHDGSYGSGRFCGQRCARGFSTKGSREDISEQVSETLRSKGIRPPKQYEFKSGDANLNKTLDRRRKISESNTLHQRKRMSEDLSRWKNGELQPSARRAKNLLIFEFGEKYSECGWAERNSHSNTIPVELEHRDGDCYNNAYSNVCLLCPNDHSLTSTFRGLNVGKGKGREFYKVVSRWAKENHVRGIWKSKRSMVPPAGIEPASIA